MIEGLYEQIINLYWKERLNRIPAHQVQIHELDKHRSADFLTAYLAEMIHTTLLYLRDEGIASQLRLINEVLEVLVSYQGPIDEKGQRLEEPLQLLRAIISQRHSMHQAKGPIIRPLSPIATSSLFTGDSTEPSLDTELQKEILTSDSVDMLVSFIKWSGLRKIINELRSIASEGKPVRIIATTYMGATDPKAIAELVGIEHVQVKISFDTKRTRLHAKSYIFHRDTGFSVAYIGSSNLSHAALTDGLEWNVKIAKAETPQTFQKVRATFEQYWLSPEFVLYTSDQESRLQRSIADERRGKNSQENANFFFEIKPYVFQQEILDQLAAERTVHNHYKNLIVAATGTGKTVVSAFDYKNFCDKSPAKQTKLLFVAHREEILRQSLFCFRTVLGNPNFGQLYVGSDQPDDIDHLFISIQTFEAKRLATKIEADFYDFIIVDEFHRAAAPSYATLLAHFSPTIFLGLTATPERLDAKDIFGFFDHRIAAEIRLPEAIERKLLCPFHYFGVTDVIDFSHISWTKGRYDTKELSNILTLDSQLARQRVQLVIDSLNRYTNDMREIIALGFCVSVEHAQYMARAFEQAGLEAKYVTGKTPREERRQLKQWLTSGDAGRFLFTVDLYNEGVDIPQINTVLFLRPTESLTVFLQQLGRGLRHHDKKDCLTVLDFVGQAHRNYRYQEKFAALLGTSRHSVEKEIVNGFVSVPKGCFVQMERLAQSYVLKSIRQGVGTTQFLIEKITELYQHAQEKPSLGHFLAYYAMDAKDFYRSKQSFYRLCAQANVLQSFDEDIESDLKTAWRRLALIDSTQLLQTIIEVLSEQEIIAWNQRSYEQQVLLRMFIWTIWHAADRTGRDDIDASLQYIRSNRVICREIIELCTYVLDRIHFVSTPLPKEMGIPLEISSCYSRDQIMVAVGHTKPYTMRQGVYFSKERNCDIFLITIDKSEEEYSPSTLYEDYAIDATHFHWQSQSTTSDTSPTGKRYQTHTISGSSVLLFVRESKYDADKEIVPFSFLGPAEYESHTGSYPMSIIWKLTHPIPARFRKRLSHYA